MFWCKRSFSKVGRDGSDKRGQGKLAALVGQARDRVDQFQRDLKKLNNETRARPTSLRIPNEWDVCMPWNKLNKLVRRAQDQTASHGNMMRRVTRAQLHQGRVRVATLQRIHDDELAKAKSKLAKLNTQTKTITDKGLARVQDRVAKVQQIHDNELVKAQTRLLKLSSQIQEVANAELTTQLQSKIVEPSVALNRFREEMADFCIVEAQKNVLDLAASIAEKSHNTEFPAPMSHAKVQSWAKQVRSSVVGRRTLLYCMHDG